MDRTQRNNQLSAFACTLEAVNAVMLVKDCAELGIDPSGLSAEQAATLVNAVRTLHMAPTNGRRPGYEDKAFIAECTEGMRNGVGAGDGIASAFESNMAHATSPLQYISGQSPYMRAGISFAGTRYAYAESTDLSRPAGDNYYYEQLDGVEAVDGFVTPTRYVRLTHIDPEYGLSEIVMRAERLAEGTMAPLEILDTYDWSSLRVHDYKMAVSTAGSVD